MRTPYLLSLTRQNPDGRLKNVACIPSSIWSSPGSLLHMNAFTGAPDTVPQVGGSERVVTADSATVLNVAQTHPRQYPYTRRVPDYDRMRYMAPEDMVRELRNPSIVVTEPLVFAAPRPLRTRKVDRANISAIVDYDWEVWRGGVRLVSTKQDTVNYGQQLDRGLTIWPPFLPHPRLAIQSNSGDIVGHNGLDKTDKAPASETTATRGCTEEAICPQNRQAPVCPASIDVNDLHPIGDFKRWGMNPASTGSNTSSSTARSPDCDNGGLLKTPARSSVLSNNINTTTGQTGDSPSRKCDWIDCPFCPTSTGCTVEEVLYPGGKVGIPQSLVARDEVVPCENSRSLRQVASKTSTPCSSEFVDGRADKRRAWQKPPARNRRSGWIERPVYEQHGIVPTTAVRSGTKGRKSSESKEGGLDARERFYETATLLGLVRRW